MIEGGRPLGGRVRAAGNKNGALPILAACLLTDEPVVLTNVPRIRDVETMLALLARPRRRGRVDRRRTRCASTRPSSITHRGRRGALRPDPRARSCSPARCSRGCGRASLPPPGGDVIGRRRLDTHVHAFEQLGAEVDVGGRYELRADRLRGPRIFLDEASVMGTENAVMAAVLAEGETALMNAACEPHVQDLCRFLVSLGAQIDGIGSNVLRIDGVERLARRRAPDRPEHIEVGELHRPRGRHRRRRHDRGRRARRPRLDPAGVRAARRRASSSTGTSVRVPPDQELVIRDDLGGQIPKIEDGPWPAFPADLTSIALAVATQARGTILIFEKMFENRLFFVDKLVSMGARIILCDPHRAVVNGPAQLYGQRMASPDIRAGMAMLIAGLCAEGTSMIGNIERDRPRLRADRRAAARARRVDRARLAPSRSARPSAPAPPAARDVEHAVAGRSAFHGCRAPEAVRSRIAGSTCVGGQPRVRGPDERGCAGDLRARRTRFRCRSRRCRAAPGTLARG